MAQQRPETRFPASRRSNLHKVHGSTTFMAVAARAGTRRRGLRLQGKGLFLVPAALYLVSLTFFPMFQLVRMSFSRVTPEVLYRSWPFAGLEEFQLAIKSPDFVQALVNTLIYVGVVVVSGLVGGFVAALILW